MVYQWDRAKPDTVNERTWRRQQIEKYIFENSNQKPQDVLNWIRSQNPNPWPSCDSNRLWKIIRRIRKKNLSLWSMVLNTVFQPLMIKWDLRLPEGTNIHKWRRAQITRYLDEFPTHKPKQVLKKQHARNP